jgi:titin
MFVLNRHANRKQQPSRFCRPRIEALEERRLPSTFTVSTISDSGLGSLRQAILYADGDPGPNTIVFNIAGGHNVKIIALTSALPTLATSTTIDGTTQLGFQGTPVIALDGTRISGAEALTIDVADCTVRGLAIYGFDTGIHFRPYAANGLVGGNYIGPDASGVTGPGNREGIFVEKAVNVVIGGTSPADRNVISGNVRGIHNVTFRGRGPVLEGNYIGTDATGTAALGNHDGLYDEGNFVQIGGTDPGAGNLISANTVGLDLGGLQAVVQGNRIGTDVTGTLPLGNGTGVRNGPSYRGSEETIGGTDPGSGNLISGNGVGIALVDYSSYNVIQGNLIGTDVTGTQPLGNTTGIDLEGSYNLIGGTTTGAGNIISANGKDGIVLMGAYNLVQGNYIGTDVTGTQPLGNGGDGIRIIAEFSGGGSYYDQLGGPGPGAGNVIANNGGDGIYNDGEYTVVQGNLIGTDVTGTVPMGNAGNGVVASRFGRDSIVGGTDPGAGNVIVFSGLDGVLVSRIDYYFYSNPVVGNVIAFSGQDGVQVDYSFGIPILINSIHDSGRLGIELTNNGNQNQAFPDLAFATLTNTGTLVKGTLTSTPNTDFTLEFFANDACNASGYGEGQNPLGDATVTTGPNGQVAFVVTVGAANPGQFIAATATDPGNNTSAFSNCIPLTALARPGSSVRDATGFGAVMPGLARYAFAVVSWSSAPITYESPRMAFGTALTDLAFSNSSAQGQPWLVHRSRECGHSELWTDIFTNPVEVI